MSAATVTTKGQVTIPKPIRDRLRLRAGSRVDFELAQGGAVLMRARNRDVRELKGIVSVKAKRPVTIKDMNEAIATASSQL